MEVLNNGKEHQEVNQVNNSEQLEKYETISCTRFRGEIKRKAKICKNNEEKLYIYIYDIIKCENGADKIFL